MRPASLSRLALDFKMMMMKLYLSLVQVENKKKNRYPDKLPYDHNRVILNALVNGSNSDYINASTVMDHDPRNPAYIITQGPMTHTVADFWQMVWEQGSVVIVMLSKLSENGYQLCHRYWPEEGSEQYHIFEVNNYFYCNKDISLYSGVESSAPPPPSFSI